MKIARISVYQVDIPVPGGTYHLSGGRAFPALDSTLVKIETDAGLTGWGESCPFGSIYLEAHAAGVRAGLGELAPQLIGRDPTAVERLNEVMDAALPGHFHVKSALDLACWDIAGKAAGRPVCEIMGGRTEGAIDLVSSVSCEAPEVMVETVARFRAEGYRAHSAKLGTTVAEDRARIAAIQAAARPGEVYQLDVNRGWTVDTALRVLTGVAGDNLYLEQPCATLRECRAVRQRTGLPVMLDEIIVTPEDLLQAIRDEAIDGLNLKIARVGGLTKSRRLRDLCAEAGIALSIQETGGADLALAAVVQLSQSTPRRIMRSLWDPRELADVTLADGAPENADGRMEGRPGPRPRRHGARGRAWRPGRGLRRIAACLHSPKPPRSPSSSPAAGRSCRCATLRPASLTMWLCWASPRSFACRTTRPRARRPSPTSFAGTFSCFWP